MAYNHRTVRNHEPKPFFTEVVIGALSESRQRFFHEVWLLANGGNKGGNKQYYYVTDDAPTLGGKRSAKASL